MMTFVSLASVQWLAKAETARLQLHSRCTAYGMVAKTNNSRVDLGDWRSRHTKFSCMGNHTHINQSLHCGCQFGHADKTHAFGVDKPAFIYFVSDRHSSFQARAQVEFG